jgi:rod shape-determining protein MreD
MKKALFFIILFLFLTLLQISFFNFTKVSPNFVLVAFLAILFFQKKNLSWGIFLTLLAGFLLDIFSGSLFGANILSLLLIYLFFILILNFILNANIIEAVLLIILGVVLYNLSIPILNFALGRAFGLDPSLQFNFGYLATISQFVNSILGVILFFVISISTKATKYISAN